MPPLQTIQSRKFQCKVSTNCWRVYWSGHDEFAYHNKMYFSTPDNDNDKWSSNCADSNKSGWWFNSCDSINLNEQPIEIQGNIIFGEMKI